MEIEKNIENLLIDNLVNAADAWRSARFRDQQMHDVCDGNLKSAIDHACRVAMDLSKPRAVRFIFENLGCHDPEDVAHQIVVIEDDSDSFRDGVERIERILKSCDDTGRIAVWGLCEIASCFTR